MMGSGAECALRRCLLGCGSLQAKALQGTVLSTLRDQENPPSEQFYSLSIKFTLMKTYSCQSCGYTW